MGEAMQQRQQQVERPRWRAALGGLAPALAVALALVALTIHCHGLLDAALAGQRPAVGGAATWAVLVAFVGACAFGIVWHGARVARAIAGPELRLVRALQRARAGEPVPPIRLRRGDLLAGLAEECNALLATMPPRPGAASAAPVATSSPGARP